MPVTIYTADLAQADLPDGRLLLRYTGEGCLPSYRLVRVDQLGQVVEQRGPFDHEDDAMTDADALYAQCRWTSP